MPEPTTSEVYVLIGPNTYMAFLDERDAVRTIKSTYERIGNCTTMREMKTKRLWVYPPEGDRYCIMRLDVQPTSTHL